MVIEWLVLSAEFSPICIVVKDIVAPSVVPLGVVAKAVYSQAVDWIKFTK